MQKDGQPPKTPVQDTSKVLTAEALKEYYTLKQSLGESLNAYQTAFRKKEYEEICKGYGMWKVKGWNQLIFSNTLPIIYASTIRYLQITCVVYVFILSLILMFRPAICVNGSTVNLGIEERFIVLLYNLPSYLHLISLGWSMTGYAFYKVFYN